MCSVCVGVEVGGEGGGGRVGVGAWRREGRVVEECVPFSAEDPTKQTKLSGEWMCV